MDDPGFQYRLLPYSGSDEDKRSLAMAKDNGWEPVSIDRVAGLVKLRKPGVNAGPVPVPNPPVNKAPNAIQYAAPVGTPGAMPQRPPVYYAPPLPTGTAMPPGAGAYPHGMGTGYPRPAGQEVDAGNGISIAALVLGIVSLPLYFTLIPAVLATIFGVKGMRRSRAATGRTNGMATAGLVLGIVSVSFLAVLVLFFGLAFGLADSIGGGKVSQCRRNLGEIAPEIVRVYDRNGGYVPFDLSEVAIPEQKRLDPWGREWFYYPMDSGFYLGSHGPDPDDPEDDIWWDGYTGKLGTGPLDLGEEEDGF